MLKTKYQTDYYDVTAKFKENINHLEKIVVFLPENCYCCT